MYHVDNPSTVTEMPVISGVQNAVTQFFTDTEGGDGAPTYPGAEWFNIIQTELLNVLIAAGIDPDKADLTQLTQAIKKIIADAGYYSPDSPPPQQMFTADAPGSVMQAILSGLPADYPLYPTEDTPITTLFPEDGYLFAGSVLVYGATKASGDKYYISHRGFTGTWALLSGLVMEYKAPPSAPLSGCFMVQSVDVSGVALEHIASAAYFSENTDYLNAMFTLPDGKKFTYTAWKDSPNDHCKKVYDHCVTRLTPHPYVEGA